MRERDRQRQRQTERQRDRTFERNIVPISTKNVKKKKKPYS